MPFAVAAAPAAAALLPAPVRGRGGRFGSVVVRAEAPAAAGGGGINPAIRKGEDKVVDSVVVAELAKPLTAYCRQGVLKAALPCSFASFHGTNVVVPSTLRSRSHGLCCAHGDRMNSHDLLDDFQVFSPDIPWEEDDIWRTFGAYFFLLHIPLSFGGLSVIAQLLHQPNPDPATVAASTAALQITELLAAGALLQHTMKPGYSIFNYIRSLFMWKKNWLQGTAMDFGFLMAIGLLSSFIADVFIGPETVDSSILKEMMSHSWTSRIVCCFLYCMIAPLLEETVYRGFLLTSLSSKMKRRSTAIILSSAVFSIAHFSGEGFLQLFIVGCVLGCTYCRTGTLLSSLAIHSVYNGVILYQTMVP